MTDFINPKDVGADKVVQAIWSISTGGGADFSFECIGHIHDDAAGAGVLPPRLGREHHHRRRGAGQEIATRPFQLVTGRVWKGTAFGGATRPHRRAEDRRLVHGREDQYRRPDHAHHAARKINEAST